MALIPSLLQKYIGRPIPTKEDEVKRLDNQASKIESLRTKKDKLPEIKLNLDPIPEGFMPKV